MGGKISHPSVSTILPIADNGSSTATSSKNSPKNAAKDLEKTEMQLDLEEELEAKREEEMAERQRLAVNHVVENLFPYAPVKVQAQKYPTSSPKAGKPYLWITLDEDSIQKRGGPPSPIRYPVGVAIDAEGNVFVSESNSSPKKPQEGDSSPSARKISSHSILGLAQHAEPPPAPGPPKLVEATQHSLTIKWRSLKDTTIDRYEVQYRLADSSNTIWATLITVFSRKHVVLDDVACHMPYEFRVRAHNPAGWSEYSAPSAIVWTLAGIPTLPSGPIIGAISNSYISVYWSRANDNGAKPVYYTLEGREASAEASEHFHRLYYGIECGFVVANLKSNTTYLFRLKSENHVGETSWIESKSVKTSVHVRPEIMELTRAEKNATYDRWVVCWDPKTEQIFYFNKFTCQRQIEEPPEVLEARQQKGLLGVEETPEMLFRRKRFRFHRDLRASVPSATLSTIVPIEISRDQIFEDTLRIFTAVMSTKQQLLCKPKISFLNEPGIDSGGLTKDWYLQVSKAILDSSRKLFKPADQGFYEFHPGGDVKSMRFIGKFIAKAIFDRQTLDLPLCEMIWKQMMGVNVSQNGGMEELKAIDAQYHKSLQWMLENDVTNVIDETFSVEDPTLGIVDLKENGREIAVSESNKKEYVQLLVQWRLEFSIQRQFQALIQGFGTLIPLTQLKSFELEEFKMLVNGKPTIDIEELRASTVFQGGYHENAQVVLWLWQALREFDQQKRGLFLKFMTGTNKIPLDGFEPPLNLTKSDLDPKALPRTHTCFNQLVLPEYPTYDILVEKITFAIMNAEGFELS